MTAAEIIGLLIEYLRNQGNADDIVRIAENTNRVFARVVLIVKAAELLGLVDTPMQLVVLTAQGRRMVDAEPLDRKALWREQLLTLHLFKETYEVLQRQPDHAVESDFIRIALHMA